MFSHTPSHRQNENINLFKYKNHQIMDQPLNSQVIKFNSVASNSPKPFLSEANLSRAKGLVRISAI